VELATLAAETGLQITVCHFPPGTSKWNKVEHRLFSHITMNWRGRPLSSHEVNVQSIAATTTSTGLRVHAELDTGQYPTGVTISPAQMNAVPITGHTFHPDWNYTLYPQPAPTGHETTSPDTWDRATLTDPRLTGISRTDLAALADALTTPHQAERDKASQQRLGAQRRRAPGAGRRPKLTLTDQITATLLHQHLSLPTTVLARLFQVSDNTIRHTINQTQRLLDQHGFSPEPPAAHLSTLAGLSRHAEIHGIHPTTKIKPAC